jgi:hypothetical protein
VPASPDDAAELAAHVLETLSAAELALIDLIATRLRAGITGPGWEAAKLAEIWMLRQRLAAGVSHATPAVLAQVRLIVYEAYAHGEALARIDTTDAGLPFHLPEHGHGTVERLADQMSGNVEAALIQTPELLINVYEQTVRAGVADVLGGTMTRLQAAQSVLDALAERGVTGFRDRAGRNWALESYAEMAVRTGAGHAAVQGHVDALAASGIDLVIVSDAPRECPLCRPWERKILSISGRVGAVIEPSVLTGTPRTVNVTASLAAARAAGFQHPNCRHSVSAYLPGVTIAGVAQRDPAGYEAGQRQRQIERAIRAWKRRQVVALDDAAARVAGAKVREWQAALRAHIDANELRRLTRREQIGTAL